jgi:hypothetical protein
VASFAIESGGELLLGTRLRLLHASASSGNAWTKRSPHASAFGPNILFRTDIPKTELEWLKPCDELPAAYARYTTVASGGRPRSLRRSKARSCSDAGTSLGGVLQVWWTPWLEDRTIPELRSLLELPFEHVLVSHGQPVHTRTDFEAALERPPWTGK